MTLSTASILGHMRKHHPDLAKAFVEEEQLIINTDYRNIPDRCAMIDYMLLGQRYVRLTAERLASSVGASQRLAESVGVAA